MQTNNSVKLMHNADLISAQPCVSSRNGFIMKLMKLKLQDPSIAWAPSKAMEGDLVMSLKCAEILQLIYERNLMEFYQT
jgi:hypothetical protein